MGIPLPRTKAMLNLWSPRVPTYPKWPTCLKSRKYQSRFWIPSLIFYPLRASSSQQSQPPHHLCEPPLNICDLLSRYAYSFSRNGGDYHIEWHPARAFDPCIPKGVKINTNPMAQKGESQSIGRFPCLFLKMTILCQQNLIKFWWVRFALFGLKAIKVLNYDF